RGGEALRQVVRRSGSVPKGGSKRSFIEVLDSESERCRMRLPLIGRWFEGRRKRLSRKENFRK
ncbi:hypothetical protein, partial [Escherichia coli]|uniref:hypothetical protein n=1 Tax=Escherichia coli TaxID=562 RepID=UPI00227F3031